jgi:hypothetical protein
MTRHVDDLRPVAPLSSRELPRWSPTYSLTSVHQYGPRN